MLFRVLVNQAIRHAAAKKIHEELARHKQAASESTEDGDRAEPPPPPPPCDVAFLFALGIESGGLVDYLPEPVTTECQSYIEHVGQLNGRQIMIAETGVGADCSAQATEDIIALHKPPWIVSAGFASGLTETAKRGHILMADQVTDLAGEQLNIGLKMDRAALEAAQGLHVGRLLTVDHEVTTAEEREKLAKRTNAIACDMETMAVARVCARRATRFLSVRVISDTVDDKLSHEVEHLLKQKSLAGKMGAFTGALVRRPSSIKDMWKLKSDALGASERLAKFLRGVLPQLVPTVEDT